MRSSLSRSTTIFGLVALFMCHVVGAEPFNVTVDDTDPSIEYVPSDAWRASSAACSQCLLVDTSGTFNKTFHTGVNVLTDMDDLTTSLSSTTPTHTSSSPAPTESEGDDDRDHDGDDIDSKKKGRSINRRLDPDDPGFVDTPVTAAFKFNGTAVYLFCVQPDGPPPSVLVPTMMNLSFTLDNEPLPSYFHNATDDPTGFTPQFNVLALQNLTLSPHVLLVNLGVGSTFVFDYMIYTTEDNGTAAGSGGTGTSASGSVQTSAIAASSNKRGKATFIGVIVGVVGVLAVCAAAIFLSICCRRRKAARRERREREAEGGTGQDQMVGPRPFIPRYFPGTVPPPYSPVPSSHSDSEDEPRPSGELPDYRDANANTGTIAPSASGQTAVVPGHALTYADIPPPVTAQTLVLPDRALTYADVPPATPPEDPAHGLPFTPAPTTLAVPPSSLPPDYDRRFSPTGTTSNGAETASSHSRSHSRSSSVEDKPDSEPGTNDVLGSTRSFPVPGRIASTPSSPRSHTRRPSLSLVLTSPPESDLYTSGRSSRSNSTRW